MGYYTNYELSASYCKIDNNGTRTKVVPIPELVLGCLEKEIEKMDVFEDGSSPAEIKYDDFDPLKLSSVDGSDEINSYSCE